MFINSLHCAKISNSDLNVVNVESVNVRAGFDTGYTQSQRSGCGLDELGGDIVADWSLEHVACVTS